VPVPVSGGMLPHIRSPAYVVRESARIRPLAILPISLVISKSLSISWESK
jgi:hypothetical protein